MRRVNRPELSEEISQYLATLQNRIDNEEWNVKEPWDTAKGLTDSEGVFDTIVDVLKHMTIPKCRCMYCLGEGNQVEHFRPKARTKYPEHTFKWENMLWSCGVCNNAKSHNFPTDPANDRNGAPLIVDPSVEEPWDFLKLDKKTWHLSPRYDKAKGATSAKGSATVFHLKLDRDSLEDSLEDSYAGLIRYINRFIDSDEQDIQSLIDDCFIADKNDLLGWCFYGLGQNEEPFAILQRNYPQAWASLKTAYHNKYRPSLP